jgi:hypothetical protein
MPAGPPTNVPKHPAARGAAMRRFAPRCMTMTADPHHAAPPTPTSHPDNPTLTADSHPDDRPLTPDSHPDEPCQMFCHDALETLELAMRRILTATREDALFG